MRIEAEHYYTHHAEIGDNASGSAEHTVADESERQYREGSRKYQYQPVDPDKSVAALVAQRARRRGGL